MCLVDSSCALLVTDELLGNPAMHSLAVDESVWLLRSWRLSEEGEYIFCKGILTDSPPTTPVNARYAKKSTIGLQTTQYLSCGAEGSSYLISSVRGFFYRL